MVTRGGGGRKPSTSVGRGPEFTVMTYNVGNGLARPDRLASALRSSGAGVIGLQELDQSQSRALEGSLSEEYPYQILLPGGFEGMGLLSRYPATSAEVISLPLTADLICTLDLEGRKVTIIVAHPPPPISFSGMGFGGRTEARIRRVIEAATSAPPSVILGDLNAASWQKTCCQLRGVGLLDAFAAAGRGRGSTLPVRLGRWRRLEAVNRILMGLPLLPLVRVDYIWHTSDIQALGAWLGDDAGSDHLPVLARLALRV